VKLRFVRCCKTACSRANCLLSDAKLRKLYPRDGGYKFFLIAPPTGSEQQVQRLLERGLQPRPDRRTDAQAR